MAGWSGAPPSWSDALGVGGTNAHVVLEEAPPVAPAKEELGPHLLLLSARTETALASARARLAEHLEQHPDETLADLAYTLRTGRRHFGHRRPWCATITQKPWRA